MGTSLAACRPWRMAWAAMGVCHSQGVQIRARSATSVLQAAFHAASLPVNARGASFWNSAMRAAAFSILAGLMSLMAVISAWPSPTSHSSMSIKLLPLLPSPMRAMRTFGRASVCRSKTEPCRPAWATRSPRKALKSSFGVWLLRPREVRIPPSPSKPPLKNFRRFMPSN